MSRNLSDKEIQAGIDVAWDRDAARVNVERWLDICKREDLGDFPENINLLTRLFGASWYFTRFVFFLGRDIAEAVDRDTGKVMTREKILAILNDIPESADLKKQIEQLRINKNRIMLRIFLSALENKFDQRQQEQALTDLAEATLSITLELICQSSTRVESGQGILTMGRMAGYEMNFGSDLDLIFLYDSKLDEEQYRLTRQIETLLRHIAAPSPHGVLYEIDMRLRPHGTSGTLVSSCNYFTEYHTGEREIWERQMMTRCRPVLDDSGLAADSLATVHNAVYVEYDEKLLRREIISMRYRVEKELGSPKGKFEIKRGPGGIMDIDFLTHFLQLMHGRTNPELQTPSTRHALERFQKAGLLDKNKADDLVAAYNYLKRIEAALRVMDMKNISSFPAGPEENTRLARAMGYLDKDQQLSTNRFIDEYKTVTGRVRGHFISEIGAAEDI